MRDKYKPLIPEIPSSIPVQKNKSNLKLGQIIFGIFLGIGIGLVFVELGLSDQWVTNQDVDNLTFQAYQNGYTQGVIVVANYTTLTGNFTYINNGSMKTRGIQDYCVLFIENLNITGGK